MTLQYDIEQYEDIKNGGFAYDLSEDTITIVNQLAEQVGAPSYNKTPVFENKEYKKRKYNGNLTGEDWEAFRNFKATEIATSSGINKLPVQIGDTCLRTHNQNIAPDLLNLKCSLNNGGQLNCKY